MPLIDEPGFYTISAAEYHADPCKTPSLSRSVAEKLLDCPRKGWVAHPRLNPNYQPDEGTTATDRGTCAHTLLLGVGQKIEVIDFKDFRTKAAQEQRDVARQIGMLPIIRATYDKCQRMVNTARDFLGDNMAFTTMGGMMELCAVSNDPTGATARSLIDFYGNKMPGGLECWDYKTTDGSASPAGAEFWFNRDGYPFQAAFQERCIVTNKPELAGKIKFRFLVQETEPPYLCSILEPTEAAMHMARKQVALAMGIWRRCVSLNLWPAYPSEVVPINTRPGAESAWLAKEMDEGIAAIINSDPYLSGVVE